MTRSGGRRQVLGAVAVAIAVITGACTSDAGTAADFCTEVGRVPALETVVAGFADADPQELSERLDEARRAYDALESAAPGDIHGDVTAVVDLVDAVIDGVEAHPDDPEAVAAELRKAMADHQGAATAANAVAAYAKDRCDVDLNPVVATGGPTTTTDPTVPAEGGA